MSLVHNLSSQELVDKIGIMVVALDNQGKITMINSAGCHLLGYPQEELIGKDWISNFILPQDRQALADLFIRIFAGKGETTPHRRNIVVVHGGKKRLISWHNTLLTGSDGTIEGILCSGEDITEQVRAEQKIRQSEARYRHFLEHVPEGLFIFDSDGIILDVNQQACKRLGYTRRELLGMNFSDVGFDGQHLQKNRERKEWPITYQGTHLEKSGRFFPVEITLDRLEENGSSVQYIAVARDMGKRLFQDPSLQNNRDLLSIIIDAIPEIICVKDSKRRWLLANKCAVDLYGIERLDYIGKTDWEIAEYSKVYRKNFQAGQKSDFQAWQNREPVRTVQDLRLDEGIKRVFDVFKVPLFYEDGNDKALVVIGRDVTEQKAVEDRYRQLFDQSPLAYVSTTLSGEIVAVNQTVVKLVGYTQDELVGSNLAELFTPESREMFFAHFSRFIKGEQFSGTDYEIVKADGSVAIVLAAPALIRDDAGKPVNMQCVALDLTRERRAEEQVRASEERYRFLFERAPVGFVHFDNDLQVIRCNRYYCRLVGVPRERLLGFSLKTLQDQRVVPALKKPLAGKEGRWQGNYRGTLTDKKVFISLRTAPLHDAQGNVFGGIAIIVDRSGQRRAETEKVMLMSAIDQTTETVVITDTEGVIEYVNPAFERVTGFTAEETVGKTPRILKSNLHGEGFYRQMWQTLIAGRVWKGRVTNKHRDGSLLKEDMTISPVRDQEGVITNYVAVKRNVTREVALEKQLHQAQKMEAIGTLAGGIAHDFNNILSAILGYADMVDRQLSRHGLKRRDVGRIITAGKRAADLVKQILTFSRQKEAELQPVQLPGIIREALNLLHSSLPATVQLRQEIDASCGLVAADPVRIHQVVINLCTNSMQAMDGGQGELVVKLYEAGEDYVCSGNEPESGKWVVLEVRDTGCGITPDMRSKVFDPFFSTRKEEGGTGLGLSVVHGIVQSHGGEIVVTETRGGGTTFRIYLPVVQDVDNAGKETVPDEQLVFVGGNEHIMIVDDEPLLVDVTQRLLADLGYSVTSFTDSSAALEWIRTTSDNPDLVITDMTMPYLTGAELTTQILDIYPSMPIILCSGYSESMDAEKARQIGIARFVIKPVENMVLAELVRRVLDGDSS